MTYCIGIGSLGNCIRFKNKKGLIFLSNQFQYGSEIKVIEITRENPYL